VTCCSLALVRPPISADRDLAGTHPTGNDFNWLAKRQVGNAVAYAAARYASGKLIDIGCGEKPYVRTFAGYVSEHVGVDHSDSPNPSDAVDIFASAYEIPAESESFDTALMSELLEHLEEPSRAVSEAFRLLTPGGHLIVTSPLFWVLHEEPRDFYRYTPNGFRWLLEQAGFDVLEVTPVAGQWSTLSLMASYAIQQSLHWRLGRLARALQHVGMRLDRVDFHPWMAHNHLAVARRPA
jgi:ubiquinone/menaquinone biosynthesis C-methylase UbiE